MISPARDASCEAPNLSLVTTYLPFLWLLVRGLAEVLVVWGLAVAGVNAPALIIIAAALVAADVQLHASSLLDHACAFTALPVLAVLIHGAPLQPLAPVACQPAVALASDVAWAGISLAVVGLRRQDAASTVGLMFVATLGTGVHLTLACFDLTLGMSLVRTAAFYVCCGVVHFTRAALHLPLKPGVPRQQAACGCACLHTLTMRDAPVAVAPVLIAHDLVALALAAALVVLHAAFFHMLRPAPAPAGPDAEHGEVLPARTYEKPRADAPRVTTDSGFVSARSSSRERVTTVERRSVAASPHLNDGKPPACDDAEWAMFCAAKAAGGV